MFVMLETIGGVGVQVAVNPNHVVTAQEFDSGRGGVGTTLKFVNGDNLHVRGTLADVLAQLAAKP